MTVNSVDTITAVATPGGRGGVAIVRLSGPLTQEIAKKILGQLPKARYASFLRFKDQDDQAIDEGIALFFSAPHSFTGEDVLELHGHGGPAVVNCLLKRIISLGARLARPGEFSERAFLNGKMDLTQAEAVADLIDAASDQAARSAMRSLQGEFSKCVHALTEKLIHLRMYVEAAIDFAEEEIDFLADQQVANQLADAILHLSQVETKASQGSLLRDGVTAVIAGKPNVGKSSLLNCLSGKETAIVTDIPGTTRDVLREFILIDGMPMHIIDTAGLRDAEDCVEQEGVRRARGEIERADIILFVTDASQHDPSFFENFLREVPEKCHLIVVRNKIDLAQEKPERREENNRTIISLSAKESMGIEFLKDSIKWHAGFNISQEGSFSARRRHLDALTRAKKFLQNGQEQLSLQRAGELLAEDLRQAQRCLGEITGVFTTDDLLGKIFSSFCVGK